LETGFQLHFKLGLSNVQSHKSLNKLSETNPPLRMNHHKI